MNLRKDIILTESRNFPDLDQCMAGEFRLASLECPVTLFWRYSIIIKGVSSQFKCSDKNLGGIGLWTKRKKKRKSFFSWKNSKFYRLSCLMKKSLGFQGDKAFPPPSIEFDWSCGLCVLLSSALVSLHKTPTWKQ